MKNVRPKSSKDMYWEFGRRLSENVKDGIRVQHVLDDFNQELERNNERPINKGTASKLKKAYELYSEEFGFNIEMLKSFSAFDLWEACTRRDGVQMVSNKSEAEVLIERLRNGETLSAIQRKANVLRKTNQETFIEDISISLGSIKSAKKARLEEITDLTNEFKELIKKSRADSQESSQLLKEYVLAIATLYVRK